MSSPDVSHCPRCPELPLRSVRTQHGAMGLCTRCQGNWVTQAAGGFLQPLLMRLVEQLTANVRHGLCVQGLHTLAPGQERCEICPVPVLRCPACASRLLPLKAHGQTVDVCTHCPGLWLDANELAALRRAQRRPLAARPQTQSSSLERSEAPRTSLGESAINTIVEGEFFWLIDLLLDLLY